MRGRRSQVHAPANAASAALLARSTFRNSRYAFRLITNKQKWIADGWGKTGAFTLIELMVVIGIMILLAAFIAPAFTNLKSAGDVTSAAYTIKGALDTARTYAKANNTYTWVGFAGSIGSTITGRVQVAIV